MLTSDHRAAKYNALNNNTMLKAKDALSLGVVDAVYEPADFLEHSVKFAADILSGKKNFIFCHNLRIRVLHYGCV